MAFQWLSLVGAIWLQSISGTNTNFPAYSSQLKQLLSLTQLQLNNLAFASDAGKLLGFFSGIAALHLPLWLVLLIGSTLGFIGYGVQYLFFLTNSISSLPYWVVFLLTVVAGNSICWINTVCYVIAIQNFPLDRQVAVGLSMSYQGLSGKIYADVVDVFVVSNNSSSPPIPIDRAKAYLLLNSILPLIVWFVAAPLARKINSNSGRSKKLSNGFIAFFIITMVTGTYAVITSLESIRRSSSLLTPSMILIGLGVVLVAPLVIPLVEKIRETLEHKCLIRSNCDHKRVYDVSSMEEEGDHGVRVAAEDGISRGGGGGQVELEVRDLQVDHDMKKDEEEEDEDGGVMGMVKTTKFWLYFFVYLFGATLGMVYLNNLGQIAESRGCSVSTTSTLVSLASSFGFFGRLIPFLLEYHLISRTKYKVSRAASIAMMMAPMTGAFFLLLNSSGLSLQISTAIIGICTGAITSISVSTTTELFGAKNFSVNHNIVVTNIPIGSFLFGDLAALLYRRQASISGNGKCMGMQCYQTSFIIWGTLCFLGTFLALILHSKTRKFYPQKF